MAKELLPLTNETWSICTSIVIAWTLARRRRAKRVTLLHLACKNGWTEIARELVARYRCDPMDQDEQGYIPLHYAVHFERMDIVRYLLSLESVQGMHSAYQDNYSYETPLHLASNNGNLEIVKYLVEVCRCSVLDADKNGSDPLLVALIPCFPARIREEATSMPMFLWSSLSGETNVTNYIFSKKLTNLDMSLMRMETLPYTLSYKNGSLTR